MDTISGNDLVYYTKNGIIQAGGYSINSTLLKNNIPAVNTYTGGKKQKSTKINMSTDTEKVSDKFNNMVIPAGLLYLDRTINNSANAYGPIEICEMGDVVSDDLYSKLVDLAEIKEKEHQKKSTRGKKYNKKTTKGKKTKRVIKY
jgi:hypothetical protein